ncbi:helix-turn-helix transcriptional regulator [Novosphingobium sediminicola]|uniref:DNA-binding CsgD family transcriptional regulator/PAS domain-containing protein n=1 Tax=Novosphingobium sediminicola TaxID=563162 RepID=A0A7W6CC91_9SPHN|nr:LuxR family transcriptional regulator [Novosphingobium sediminicola]MBB3953913.1 DNA-binding CsgD family transcriptional regulator/PAS domain-containing protein [Novosphingobium sediminicola]
MAAISDQWIGALYSAIDEPARWVGLMDLLRRDFDVECVAAQLLVAAQGKALPVWGTRDSHSERHGRLHDSWANSPANPRFSRPIGPIPDMEILSDARSPAYSAQDRRRLSDGLARCGLGPAFWISHRLDKDHRFTLIFHRTPDDRRDMEPREEAMLARMAPHMHQAAKLWLRMSEAEAKAEWIAQAHDATGVAMLACDRDLRLHWCNEPARALLAEGHGLRLRHGHLAAIERHDHDVLAALVEGRSDRGVLALGGIDRPALHLRARPARHLSRDLVLLTLAQPDRPVHYAPGDIARLFGLTITEASLAAYLAAGHSVSDFAAARGIAEGTARLHLKRVLAKTGTGRQSELVRRIGGSVAGAI